jgi:hypothetical protein
MAAAVKTKAKTEHDPGVANVPVVEAVQEERPPWMTPVHAVELLRRMDTELNKRGGVMLYREIPRGHYQPALYEAYEVSTIADGERVKRVRLVDRAVELGVLDLASESPQVPGETTP